MRTALTVAWLVVVVPELLAAPVPKARPAPPLRRLTVRPGTWTLTWNGARCPTELHEDGRFRCCYCGVWWTGQWGWDEKARRLYVCESAGLNDFSWTAELDGNLSGKARVETEEHQVRLGPADAPVHP